MARALGIPVAILAAGLLWPGGAVAGLYRCPRPDGSVVYTDNPGSCPNAQSHEPEGALQRVPSAPPPRAAAPAPGRTSLRQQAEADDALSWRQKKLRNEQELRSLDEQRENLLKYVSWCNRGGELIRRDTSGLNRKVSCSGVRSELESLDARRAEIQAYLDEGLEEECRRAGCLPGWIR